MRAGSSAALAALLAACGGAAPATSSTSGSGAAPAAATAAPATGATTAPAATTAVKPASGPAKASTTTITFATDWNSGVRKETIDFTLAEFQKQNPDITVEAQHIGAGAGTSSVGGFSEQIVARFIGGTAPDLVFSWIEIVGTFRTYLTDLTPLLKTSDYNQLGITEIPTNTHWEGKQYGINFAPASGGWRYNITMFEEHGVAPPTEDWTWDDALDAMKKLTNPDEKRWGFWSYNYTEYGYLPLVMSNGGSFFTDETMKQVALCNDAGTEAFTWWVDLIHKHKVSPEPSQATGMATAESNNLFNLGLVAMAAGGLQSVGNDAKFIGDRFKWSLMPYPLAPRTGDRRLLIHTEPLVVPKDAEKRGNTEAALKLALFLAGDDTAQTYIAQNRPTIPVKTSILNSPVYTKAPPENMALIGKQLGDSARHYQTRPLVKWWAEFTQKLTAAADKAFIGEAPAADAWQEVCRATQQVVDNAG
jgi:multiple sugar transport system substrate-binding protein